MGTPSEESNWDSLSPEEKAVVHLREKWNTRLRIVEVGAAALLSQLDQCDLEPGELARLQNHLEEIVSVVRMKHEEMVK